MRRAGEYERQTHAFFSRQHDAASRSEDVVTVKAEELSVPRLTNLTAGLLSSAFATGDVDSVFAIVVAAASVLNRPNCSIRCDLLNRKSCVADGVCGVCVDGTVGGVVGSSNKACRVVGTSPACNNTIRDMNETDVDCGGTSCAPCDLDDACGVDVDCASGRCVEGKCDKAEMRCANDCSNHGSCQLTLITGELVDSCAVDNSRCTAFCACESDWNGRDCSMNNAAHAQAASARAMLIESLADVAPMQDVNTHATNQQISALAITTASSGGLDASSLKQVAAMAVSLARQSASIGLASGSADALGQVADSLIEGTHYLALRHESDALVVFDLLIETIGNLSDALLVGHVPDEAADHVITKQLIVSSRRAKAGDATSLTSGGVTITTTPIPDADDAEIVDVHVTEIGINLLAAYYDDPKLSPASSLAFVSETRGEAQKSSGAASPGRGGATSEVQFSTTVDWDRDEKTTYITLACEEGEHSNVTGTCPGGEQIVLICDGDSRKEFITIPCQCSVQPLCLTWNSEDEEYYSVDPASDSTSSSATCDVRSQGGVISVGEEQDCDYPSMEDDGMDDDEDEDDGDDESSLVVVLIVAIVTLAIVVVLAIRVIVVIMRSSGNDRVAAYEDKKDKETLERRHRESLEKTQMAAEEVRACLFDGHAL